MKIFSFFIISICSLNLNAAVICSGGSGENKIRVIAAKLHFGNSITSASSAAAITVIQGVGANRKITYHQTTEDRLPSPNFTLFNIKYDNFYISDESFNDEPSNVKAFIGQNSHYVELRCKGQSQEIEEMYFKP